MSLQEELTRCVKRLSEIDGIYHGRKEAYLQAAKDARELGAIKMPYESIEQFANKLADHFEGLAELWGEK